MIGYILFLIWALPMIAAGLGLVLKKQAPFISLIWALPMIAAGLGLVLKKQAPFISIVTIALSFVISAMSPLLVKVPSVISYPWFALLGNQIRFGILVDGLSVIMGSVVAFVSLLIAIYSYRYMYGDWGHTRYWYFFSFFVGSMLLLVYASNLIVLLIGWEGTTLASYALIGHWYTDEEEERWVGKAQLLLPMLL